MKSFFNICGMLIVVMLGSTVSHISAHSFSSNNSSRTIGTIFIAPPTCDTDTDRFNIQTAFDKEQPGDVVQFKQGAYMLGGGARVTIPDVTVLGHPKETIFRGCEPGAFKVLKSEMVPVVFGCAGFYIQAERQTIMGFTFQYFWEGIVAGPYPTSLEQAMKLGERCDTFPISPVGGQIIEDNTFRNVVN